MDISQCTQLFSLFSGVSDPDTYLPLIYTAMAECSQQLRDGADAEDQRLCYYAAALANLRYVQMLAARSTLSHTYAGTLAKTHDESIPCGFAERLVQEYRAAVSDLLVDRRFVFTGVC